MMCALELSEIQKYNYFINSYYVIDIVMIVMNIGLFDHVEEVHTTNQHHKKWNRSGEQDNKPVVALLWNQSETELNWLI